jgi:hypothetical protein
MKDILLMISILILVFLILSNRSPYEPLWTTTYTSTPAKTKITPTNIGSIWPYGVYPSLSLYPSYPDINPYNFPVKDIVPGYIADAIRQPLITYSALPNTWTQYNKPMLTSIVNPNRFITGRWVKSGIAFSVDPTDNTILDIFQRTLDPAREIYEYQVINKDGMSIPLYGIYNLKDKQLFSIPAYQGKGDFIYQEDKFDFIYI